MIKSWQRVMLRKRFAGAALATACCLALVGCGATASTPTATTSPTPTATTAPAPTATPAQPQPTPLPAGTFATYANTLYHYSIGYPSNWVAFGAASSRTFTVFNYNPQSYRQPITAPPILKIEIDAVANPLYLAPLDFFTQSLNGPGQPPATISSSQATTLAGHAAEQVIFTVAPSQYPEITYLVPVADTMLIITQNDAQNGQPSPVFTRMLNSLSISG